MSRDKGLLSSPARPAWLVWLAVASLLLLAGSLGQAPSTLDLTRWTVDGGGGCSQGVGSLALCGTAGQPDASQAILTGGSLALQGGLWAGPQALEPVEVEIYLPFTSR